MMRLPVTEAAAILDAGLPIGPRLSPCVCGGDRHEHAGKNRTGSCTRTRCRKYRPNMAYDLAYRALDAQHATLWKTLHDAQRAEREAHRKQFPKEPGHWSVGPSDTTTCPKAIEYRNRPPHAYEDDTGACAVEWCRGQIEDEIHAKPLVLARTDDRAAIAGVMLHDAITEKMRVLYPWRKYKLRVRIKGLDRDYEIDWYDPITGEVTDVKCTTWDTPVLMADGTEKRAADVCEGDRVVGWNEDEDRLTAATVAFSGDNGVQPIYRIDTAGGRTLRVTAEHPILVRRVTYSGVRRELAYEWVKADGIARGDRVVLALGWEPQPEPVAAVVPETVDERVCSVSGCTAPVDTRPPVTARRKPTAIRMCRGHRNRHDQGRLTPALRPPTAPLTTDDAYLLGALTGDGGLTGWIDGGDAGLTFSNIDQGVLNKVAAALRPWHASLSHGGGCNYRINCGRLVLEAQAFRAWLAHHDMLHGARDKRVPVAVQTATRDLRAAYLSGYLDTDGTVATTEATPPIVSWSSVSYELLRQCQTLLAGLGVRAALVRHRGAYKGQPHESWMLSVKNQPGILRLAEVLTSHGDKAARLARCAERVLASPRVGRDNSTTYNLMPVTAVTVEEPQPTWALTVAGVHTHVTSGIVSHNTVGEAKWEMLRDDGPDDDTWGQPFLYGLALEDMGHKVTTVKLVYYKRSNGRDEVYELPYDRAFAEKYRDILLGHVQALDLGMPLERSRSGPSTDVICRDYCPFRIHCWNMDEAETAGQSPESYTLVGPNPHEQNPEPDPSVVWAIEQKVAASAATSAAKKLTEQSKALLDGIEPGRYGDYEGYLTPTPGGTDDWKADSEQLRMYYDMPENLRPPLEALPVAQRRKTYYVAWKKARKATLDREKRENGVLNKKTPKPESDPATDKETLDDTEHSEPQ